MENYSYKEVWFILKKLPLNLISKIPFEIRDNIVNKAERCSKALHEIDITQNLDNMNISNEAKDILLSLYIDYLSDDLIKNEVKQYIDFCDRKAGDVIG